SCEKPIRWYHNIPIVSYVVLGGKCAHCGSRFDLRYPAVELLTGLLAVACVAVFGLTPFAGRAFVFAAILVALTYIDLEHWLLPHAITWSGIALGLLTAPLPGEPGMADALIGAGAGFAGFWLLRVLASWLFKKEALGGGDLYLLAMIGAFLGWQALLPVVFLASLQGSVVGLLLVLVTRGREKRSGEDDAQHTDDEVDEADDDWVPPANAVPFGPFLSLAAFEMLFLGEAIFHFIEVLIGVS
ncbi:MAG: prepilin peptidase, partial [Myxococcota bacterium]